MKTGIDTAFYRPTFKKETLYKGFIVFLKGYIVTYGFIKYLVIALKMSYKSLIRTTFGLENPFE